MAQADNETGPRILTLNSLVGGYNGYTSPDLLSPQFWVAASNVYAGQFGTIRRVRWAPFLNSTTVGFLANGFRILSMFSWSEPLYTFNWIFFDNDDPAARTTAPGAGPGRWVIRNVPSVILLGEVAAGIRFFFNAFFLVVRADPWPLANSLLDGPYQRTSLSNMILEANGLFRSKVRIINEGGVGITPIGEYWGIDAADVSPQITLVAGSTATISAAPVGAVRADNVVTITTTAPLPAGMITGVYVDISGVTDTTFNTPTGTSVQITVTGASTFTYVQVGSAGTSGSGTVILGITKTIGRSYQYAWENATTGHVSAPSPASQYVKYAGQTGVIDCIETGTISYTSGSAIVTGTGTSFSQAWVGKQLYEEGVGFPSPGVIVISVQGPTLLTVNQPAASTKTGQRFQVLDYQISHVRLYATGDGQPVYFLIARNSFQLRTGLITSGLEFFDSANSEPPNVPFSNEITQIYNVPPPIGQFVDQYQSRPIVYGVAGNPQTFFYGNIEATVVGQPCESFSPLNTVTLPIGDGELFGTANLPTGFILWSNRQDMFKLTGLLSDNTIANATQLGATIQRLPYAVGSASPYAKAVTPLGVIWLSSDREVWLFTDHYAPKNLGKPVQDILNRINGARMPFAKISYYKRGERSWLSLAIALDSSTFNNKLLLLDLDLLASNGEPSYYTFDLAANAPTWYQLDINCEGLCTSYDGNSVNHLMVGDVDLITDADWQSTYYTIGAEQNVPGGVTQHAFGNDDPHMIKTFDWMRTLTNQIPKDLAPQGWNWKINAYDDDKFVIGVNANTTSIIPATDSNPNTLFLEYSPAKFKFGGFRPVKGRRFQIQTVFPSAPGLYELRGFELAYTAVVGR